MEIKIKNKWDLINSKAYSKGNHKQKKRQPTEWEKLFTNDATNKILMSKIYKQLM